MRKAAPQHPTAYLLLVKPQFELDASQIPEEGVVKDEQLRRKALEKARMAMEREGIELVGAVDSRVKGREGIQEIFVLGRTVRAYSETL